MTNSFLGVRCQKPSPISRPLMMQISPGMVDSLWHAWAQRWRPAPRLPRNSRKPGASETASTCAVRGTVYDKKPKKKARAEQGVAMELKRLLHNLRFEKQIEIFPKRFNSSISKIIAIPSNTTSESSKTMAVAIDPSHHGTLEPIGVVQ